MRKSVIKNREMAFRFQRGLCFYCELPMWLEEGDAPKYASRHGLSLEAAQSLQCTAEHMRARQDDGSHDPWNIVAACLHCNRMRHANGASFAPLQYRQRVANAMAEGTWHAPEIQNRFAGIAGTTTVGRAPENSG